MQRILLLINKLINTEKVLSESDLWKCNWRAPLKLRLVWSAFMISVSYHKDSVRCCSEACIPCGKMTKSVKWILLFILSEEVWINCIRHLMETAKSGKTCLLSQCSLCWTVYGGCAMHSTPIADQWGVQHDNACSVQGKISLKRSSA